MADMPSGMSHLKTWVDAATRERFVAMAQSENLSESALLKRSVEQLINGTGAVSGPAKARSENIRSARLTARFVSGDLQLLRARAAARGMPAATYLSALAIGHLRGLTPLPVPERLELRRLINEVGAIGRNVNQLVRLAYREDSPVVPRREELMHFFKVCRAVQEQTQALLKANADSWKTGLTDECR